MCPKSCVRIAREDNICDCSKTYCYYDALQLPMQTHIQVGI